jgi:hypothetical protein
VLFALVLSVTVFQLWLQRREAFDV